MELPVEIYEEITGGKTLPPPVDEADNDRRKHRRVPFGHRATITTQRKGVNAEPNVVMVRDVSLGGLSFLNGETVKPGTSFLIEFRGQDDRPVKFRCLTQRCEAGGSGGTQFVVGATFEQLLTEQLAAPQQREEEQLMPAMTQDPGENIEIELEPAGDDSNVAPDIEAAIAAALEEAAGPAPAPEAEVEKAPEPVDEPLSAEDQQKLAARLKQQEPAEEKKPLVAPAAPSAAKAVAPKLIIPAAPAPAPEKLAALAAPAKTSGLFISGSSKSKLQFSEEWDVPAPVAQPQAVHAAHQPEEGPVFRVILLPDPPTTAAAEMELGPSTPAPAPEVAPEAAPARAAVSAPTPVVAPASEVSSIKLVSAAGDVNGNEVLTRVKEVLQSQERTIKAQRQQIKEDREKTTKELESLRAEMAQMQRKLAEIQARKDADDRAIADLAAVLASCEKDSAESTAPKPDATKPKAEAA